MAVDKTHRGKDVDTALEKASCYWVSDNSSHGRLLVSTYGGYGWLETRIQEQLMPGHLALKV